MYLFIATIFIAELIIALTVTLLIIKADKEILKINNTVCEKRKDLEKALGDFKYCVTSFGDYYDCMINSLKKKHRQFKINLIKNIAMYLSLFLLKGKYKKAAALLQFSVLFHDFWLKTRTG